MTTNDLWHEVEVDPQAAALDTAKREARKALSPKVSFLMEASTREAFDDRLALIDGDIDRIVGAVASEPAVYALTRAAVVQDLNEMFGRGEARRRRDAEAKRARVARAMGPVVDESVLVARREARKTAASASYTNYTNMDSSFMRGYEKGDTLVRGYSGTVDDVLDSAADVIFGIHNRDDRPDGQMCPSMSVGDVINIDGKWVTVLGLGFADVEVDPADITTRSWLDVVRERRGSVKKAATQAEVDSWLAKQDPTFAEWAKPYAQRMVYGPTYNRSIANNLPDAARAFNEGGMAGKQFRYVRSQLDAALGSERGEAWYWDEAQGEYTQRLQGTMASKLAVSDTCTKCGNQIHDEDGVWVDNSGGDVCGAEGDNDPHTPSMPRDAARKTAVQVHEFETSGQAYNRVQTEDWIKNGDVLVIPSEKVVGIAFSAWPAAVTKARGHLHGFTDPTAPPAGESYDTPEEVAAWAEGWAKAREVAQAKGWPLATSGDDYEDEPGSENEWSFDASKKMAIKIDWSLSAWGCDGVTADGRWGINIFRNDRDDPDSKYTMRVWDRNLPDDAPPAGEWSDFSTEEGARTDAEDFLTNWSVTSRRKAIMMPLLWKQIDGITTTEVAGFALTAVRDSIGVAWAITDRSGEIEHAAGKSRTIESAKLAMLKRADIFGQDPDIVNQAPKKKVKKKVSPDGQEVVEDPDAEDEVEDEADEDVDRGRRRGRDPRVTEPDDQVESVDPMTLDVGDTVTVSYTMGTGETGEVEGVFVRNENDIVFFSGPNGEFGVAERDGMWIDSEGNQFSFSFGSPDVTGEIDPNARTTRPLLPRSLRSPTPRTRVTPSTRSTSPSSTTTPTRTARRRRTSRPG